MEKSGQVRVGHNSFYQMSNAFSQANDLVENGFKNFNVIFIDLSIYIQIQFKKKQNSIYVVWGKIYNIKKIHVSRT